jgi:serine/threonine protein kinase
MNTEPNANRCPKCQAPLPANAPQGLCVKCLLAAVSTPTEAGQPGDRKPPPTIATVAAAFPQLEILDLIGHGGMGMVYKARQPRLDRVVALKLLPQSLAADAAFAERFNREARVLARLNHPNIVTVHDFGQSGGFFYLLMEFVDGVNLRQAMQAGRFTPQQAMMLVPRICEALQFAHDEGILHRDIKPENILLDTKGRVKIADFGIAKLIGEAREKVTLTGSGLAVGTPHYMAPEQLEHPQDVDQRADIYSLGVVFYEMLTGELPIGRFAPPSQKSSVDARVDEVVFHALEKEREKRFRSAGEVKTSVEAITSNPAVTPPPAAPAGGPARPSAAPPIPERRIPCYISTPKHLSTFTGQLVYIYTGKGELRLDAENLTFVSNWQSTVIPLRDIRELGIGHYSRLAKPVRLDYLAVTFEQAGQRRTLLFTPIIRGGISLPWEVNPRVADCFRAVREAVIARTGQAPGGPSLPALPGSDQFDPVWQAIKIALATAAVVAIIEWIRILMRGTEPHKTWGETRGGWIMVLVCGAVLLFIIAMSARDARARRNRAHDPGAFPSEPPLSPPPGSGRRPRSRLFKSSFPFVVAIALVALALLRWGLGGWHFPAFGERIFGNHAAAESAGEFVLYTMPNQPPPGASDSPGRLDWTFKCLVPAEHLAHLLVVRWTDGVPKADPGFSAYYKVGKASIDLDLWLMCERLTNSTATGTTNDLQWNVNLGLHSTTAQRFPGEPAYHRVEPPARMTVRSGHQGVLRLVDYVQPEGESRHSQSVIELRIFLEPLKSPPIRTDPFEVEGTNYVAGNGLGWTMEETLKAIKQWPSDP